MMNHRPTFAAGSHRAPHTPSSKESNEAPRPEDARGTLISPGELGRRIRQTRLERRLTLKQMEKHCALSATHISEIERGRTSPTVGALTRLARSLGRDAAYFMDFVERADVSHAAAGSTPPTTWASGVTLEPLSRGIPGSRIFPYRLQLEASTGVLRLRPRETSSVAYTVERGVVDLSIGSRQLALSAGDAAHATRNEAHVLRAAAGRAAVVLAILSHALEGDT